MQKSLIAVSSITYAMKAKKLLNNMGLYCEIQKTPKNLGSGCGYSIRVRDDLRYIFSILDAENIAHKAYQKLPE